MSLKKGLKTKLSILLTFCLMFSSVLSMFTVVSANEVESSFVTETDTHIVIMQSNYYIDIEKAGFKYSFKKRDGTVIADKHDTSGIRFTAPGGNVLADVHSTELQSYNEEVINLLVTNTEGDQAEVNIYLFEQYVKFEIEPLSGGGSTNPITEGQLNQTNTTGEGFVSAGELTWTNYTLEATMKAGNVQPGSSASGLAFRYQDYENFYHIRLHNSDGQIQLLKKLNGVFTVVHKHNTQLARDQWYDIKVELVDDMITVFLNDVEQFSYIDETDVLTAGAIGMRTYKDNVSFKNIIVRDHDEVVFKDDFAVGSMDEWSSKNGSWSLSQEDMIQSYIIDARTASLSPAYGLGDHGRNGHSTNVFGFSNSDVTNKGGEERFISNFTIFPAHGFAQVLFEEGKKRVTINASENKLGVADADHVKSLYYFFGDMEQIYKNYQSVRNAEGYPDYLPKYEFFEVGYEAFGSLGWNTYQSSVTEDLETYLDKGYDLKWAVVGSGFWKGDRNKPNEGATTSFGIWDDEVEEGRLDSLPNPRYPDVNGFKHFLSDHDIKFFLGLRVNFKAPIAEGGNYLLAHDGPFTQEGIDKGYFLKDAAGNSKKFTVNFPKGSVYILDTNNEEALDWYESGAALWEVDGFKEDTMLQSRLYQDGLWNRSNGRLMEQGNYVMVRNAAYSIPGDIIRLEDTQHGFNQDRPIINALNYAASGAPNVYSDIIAGKYLTTPLTEDQKIYFVRNAMFAALTPATSVGLGPWKMENAEYEAAVKKAVDFHSMYAPYIYSAAVDSFHTGFPHTMTPLPIAYPDHADTYELANRSTRQYEWMLGPSMLAVPAYGHDYATVSSRDVYLPEGVWIDYESGTTYHGPTLLEDYDLPIDKIPVFIGGKGVIVNRELQDDRLYAEIFPIAKDGSTYQFTHPDGVSTSVITNNNVNWNSETLVITDTTANEEIEFIYNNVTGSFKYEIISGHNYVLSDGEFEEILDQVNISIDRHSELLVGDVVNLAISARLLSGEPADLSAARIEYESNNEQVLTVNEAGQIVAVGTGAASIKASVTLHGMTVQSNLIDISVVEPAVVISVPLAGTDFVTQPISISGISNGFEQLELRMNGLVIPIDVSSEGEWSYSIGRLPNGEYGLQVLGRDGSGKIRAFDEINITVQLEELLYSTDFTGDHSEWEIVNGGWTVNTSGETTTYGFSGNGLTYAGDAQWGDYEIESKVITYSPDSNQGGGAAGIVFRYNDPGHFYHFRLDHLMRTEGEYLKTAQLYKWVGGTAIKLAEVPYEYLYDEWYDMKVIVEGDNIKAYLNDELILEENDSSLKQGQVGFRTNGRSFAVADLSVKNIIADASDKTPTWISGQLVASEVNEVQLKLDWSGAVDNDEVTSYKIILDNEELLFSDEHVTSVVVTDLLPDQIYTFKVEAGNAQGQWSTDGPIVTVKTKAAEIEVPIDTEAPTWNEDSKLLAHDIKTNKLRLTWTAAEDDEEVISYIIYKDGVVLAEVDSHTLVLNVTSLSPNTSYTFKVEAVDEAGNWSTDGPALTVRTKTSNTTSPTTPPVEETPADETEVPDDSAEDQPIIAYVDALDETVSQSLANKGTGNSATVRLAGKAYEVTFTKQDKDGEERAVVGELPEPSTVTLVYDATNVNEALLGVYYYNEESELWEYVGGVMDREKSQINVEIFKAGTYAVLEYDKAFEDVAANHWVYEALKHLSARHIVNGINEKEFAPNGKTTRAEFAALLVRALGLATVSSSSPFADVSNGVWYAEDVATAYEAGLINGLTKTTFGPDEPISREQLATMVVRAYEYVHGKQATAANQLDGFRDSNNFSTWAQENVNQAIALGLMQGKGSNEFAPREKALRSEIVIVIWNFLDLSK